MNTLLIISITFGFLFYLIIGLFMSKHFEDQGKTTGLYFPPIVISLWLPMMLFGLWLKFYEWLFSSKVTDADYFQKCPTCGEVFDIREYYLYCNGDYDNVHSRVGTDYIRAWDTASDKESESVSVCGYYDKDGKFVVKNMEYIKEDKTNG